MHSSTETVVIGGGIIGLLTARELANAGVSTTLIDRSYVGRESSWAGGGILAPLYPWKQADAIISLCNCSAALYPRIINSVQERTGVDPQLIDSGMLILDPPDPDAALDWCVRTGVPHHIPPPDLNFGRAKLEACTNNALWLPQIAQIRSPALIRGLRADLIDRGVSIVEHCEINKLVCGEHKVHFAQTRSAKFYADRFIVTSGAWSSGLLGELLPQIRISPVKGQMLLYDAEPGLLKPMILWDNRYLIPRKDGRILVGSSLEYTQFDKSTSTTVRSELQDFAVSVLPHLSGVPIAAQWAGLRPWAPSGIPYISTHPSISNLFVNCGHFRNGITTAPASARLVADLVLQRTPAVNAADYAFDARR